MPAARVREEEARMNRPRNAHWLVLLSVLVTAVLVLPVDTPADEKIYFGYEFSEGHSQQYKVKFKMEMFWGTFSQSTIVDLELTEKCLGETEDGAFKMEIVFDKVDASVMMFDRMQETGIGEALTGQTVSFVLDKFGETDDVTAMGYIESWNQVEGQIKAIIDQMYVYLPDKPYGKDEKWEHTDEKDEDGLNITARWEYTFEEWKEEKGRECAKVKAEAELGIGGVQTTPGGDYTVEGEGDGEYEFYFDRVDKIIVKMKGGIEIKSDMSPVSGGGDKVESTVLYDIEKELL
jgi:hypothetical protein